MRWGGVIMGMGNVGFGVSGGSRFSGCTREGDMTASLVDYKHLWLLVDARVI